MKFELKNSCLVVIIDTNKAEISSLKKINDEHEIMWQGDPKYWSGKNPTLFPQVGNMWAKEYYAKGKKYKMGNHGFARHSEFTLVEKNDNSVTLLLKDNEDTYNQYPYHFELFITYELVNNRLDIKYKINNLDEEIMPFGFGLHPAFNVPISDGSFNDSYIEFSDQEHQDNESSKYLIDNKINLSYDVFKDIPTLLYDNLNSSYVTLVQKDYRIKVSCEGYKFLAFWTVDNAPYLCIEPWMSLGDTEESDVPFEKRDHMINLGINESYQAAYYIEIN